jgi:hypothetical protein
MNIRVQQWTVSLRVKWMHCCTNDHYPQEEDEYTCATMNSVAKGKLNVMLHQWTVSPGVLCTRMYCTAASMNCVPREGECTAAPKNSVLKEKLNVLHQWTVSPSGRRECTSAPMNSTVHPRGRLMYCTNKQYTHLVAECLLLQWPVSPRGSWIYYCNNEHWTVSLRVRWMHCCCTNDQYPQEEDEYTTATMNSIPKRKLSALLHKN